MLCQDDRITDQSMEEIPCGNQMNFNSLSLINSPISQNTRNALPLSINCHYRRSLFSPSISILKFASKIKAALPTDPNIGPYLTNLQDPMLPREDDVRLYLEP